jgi:hypothetical protein
MRKSWLLSWRTGFFDFYIENFVHLLDQQVEMIFFLP